MPAIGPRGQIVCAEGFAAGTVHEWRADVFGARSQDVLQQQHGVVGRVAAIRLRRDLSEAGEARSERSGKDAARAGERSRGWIPAGAGTGRSRASAVGGE